MSDTGPIIADSIEGIPHPAQSTGLVGHEKEIAHLLRQYASGRMHHAWLLTGPRGIGKATLTMQMAAHVFRYPDYTQAPDSFQKSREHDPVAGKISAGSHPNLLHLTRPWDQKAKKFKTRLTVDEIRQTVPFFGTSRGETGWRVTIVDPADDMNAAASNALLKILEEPPERSLFFIVSHSPAKILPTIRSRCQKLVMEALPESDLVEVLERIGTCDGMSDDDLKLLVSLSQGSVRQAIILARDEGLDLYRKFEATCKGLEDPDWQQVHALADTVTLRGREDRYRLLMHFAQEYIEKRATGRDGQEKPVSALARWAEVWEKLQKSISLADSYNLDKKQVIINLFSNMGEAVRSSK